MCELFAMSALFNRREPVARFAASALRRGRAIDPRRAPAVGRSTLSLVAAAMGIAPETGMGAIRFGLGRGSTEGGIEAVVAELMRVLF